ncbi:MAG: hypothetical protein WA269_03450 [Candidatus Udaeobacter sp.]
MGATLLYGGQRVPPGGSASPEDDAIMKSPKAQEHGGSYNFA